MSDCLDAVDLGYLLTRWVRVRAQVRVKVRSRVAD